VRPAAQARSGWQRRHDGGGGPAQPQHRLQCRDGRCHHSADRWRELLANAGVKSAAIRGAGICRDQACDETIRALFFAGAIRDWQVVIPALGRVTGAFQITALEFGGVHDGELTFELALMSAGPLSFARA
jgi:predicted secreted protein